MTNVQYQLTLCVEQFDAADELLDRQWIDIAAPYDKSIELIQHALSEIPTEDMWMYYVQVDSDPLLGLEEFINATVRNRSAILR